MRIGDKITGTISGIQSYGVFVKIDDEHQGLIHISELKHGFVSDLIGIVGIVIAILMLLNFDEFFVIFHEVLFRNSDWLFDPNRDPVINILPEEFFTQCFILFFILFEGLNFWKANKKTFRN